MHVLVQIMNSVVKTNDENIARGLYRASTDSEREYLKKTSETKLYALLSSYKITSHYPTVTVRNRIPFDDYEVQMDVDKRTLDILNSILT